MLGLVRIRGARSKPSEAQLGIHTAQNRSAPRAHQWHQTDEARVPTGGLAVSQPGAPATCILEDKAAIKELVPLEGRPQHEQLAFAINSRMRAYMDLCDGYPVDSVADLQCLAGVNSLVLKVKGAKTEQDLQSISDELELQKGLQTQLQQALRNGLKDIPISQFSGGACGHLGSMGAAASNIHGERSPSSLRHCRRELKLSAIAEGRHDCCRWDLFGAMGRCFRHSSSDGPSYVWRVLVPLAYPWGERLLSWDCSGEGGPSQSGASLPSPPVAIRGGTSTNSSAGRSGWCAPRALPLIPGSPEGAECSEGRVPA